VKGLLSYSYFARHRPFAANAITDRLVSGFSVWHFGHIMTNASVLAQCSQSRGKLK